MTANRALRELNTEGYVELDASIMHGSDRAVGGAVCRLICRNADGQDVVVVRVFNLGIAMLAGKRSCTDARQ